MRILSLLVAVLLSTAAVAESLSVTIFAGSDSGPGYRDGVGNAARFDSPYGLAVDAGGNILVGDFSAHNVRRVTPSGVVTTLAGVTGSRGHVDGRNGMARFNSPYALAVDSSGNVYVAEWNLRKISPSGAVTTMATSMPAFGGIAVDNSGNVFATDPSGDVIRKITPGGTMTTFASTADSPRGLTIDGSNNLYFTADGGGVYKCTPQGVVTPIAGGILYPGDLDVDAAGNLYVISSQQIVKVTPGGTVTNFAGSIFQGQQDGTGAAAGFLYPRGVELSPDGTLLYVADELNNAIRRITVPGAVVTTFAGRPAQYGTTDGTGLAARFYHPRDAVVAPDGNVYVADSANRRIRRITPGGVTSTLAGGTHGTADGFGAAAQFGELSKIAVGYDQTSNWVLYVTDAGATTGALNDGRIRKITQDGSVTTIATGLHYPSGVAVSASGTIYVAEFYGHTIKKIDIPLHTVTVFAGASGMPGYVNATGTAARFQNPSGLAIDAAGMLYVSDYSNNRIRRIDPATVAVTTYAGSVAGEADGTGTAARFSAPGDIHAVGNDLYVVDSAIVRLIEPGAVVTTVAGQSGKWVNRDGTGNLARFESLSGIGGDSHTNLYICDAYSSNIRKARVAGIADVATASSTTPLPQTVVQLDTEPDTATSWTWSIERRPPNSTAEVSSASIRNPTFTPDVAELYTFLLRADGPGGIRYSTLDVMATSCATPMASIVVSTTTTAVCESGTNGTATVSVSGGMTLGYQWGYRTASGGAITPIAGATAATYGINGAELGGGTGKRYLVVTVTPGCGVATVSHEVPLDVTAAPDATISASTGVFAGSSGNFASVADAGAGATYTWSITNGTINAGQGQRTVHYTAGASGNVLLNVTVSRNGCGPAGNASVAIRARPAGATMLYTIMPCRVIDTRDSTALANGETRNVMLAGLCGIPVDAKTVVANITAVSPAASGWLALWQAGTPWGGTSTVSYRAGRTRANNAIVPVANDGFASVLNSGGAQHVIIDVTGYFR